MHMSVKTIFYLVFIMLLTGCKQKKKAPSLTGDDPVEAKDFIGFFEEARLPYQLYDSILPRKEKDSLLINPKILKQFVPDSVLTKVFGKNTKPKVYVLKKVENPKGEKFLFIKALTNQVQTLMVLAFNKDNQFIAGMPVLKKDNNISTIQSVLVDRNFGITKATSLRNKDGSYSDGKDVYVLNAETNNFILVMTDALHDKVTELINPIDTLGRQHKFAADYTAGKMNLVSIRDGRRAGQLSFFVHFEKNNGACTGELKGEATIRSSSMAEYREEGDPCVLQFHFTGSSVTLKEAESCGNRRGLNCKFEGSFSRKKFVKPTASKNTK